MAVDLHGEREGEGDDADIDDDGGQHESLGYRVDGTGGKSREVGEPLPADDCGYASCTVAEAYQEEVDTISHHG